MNLNESQDDLSKKRGRIFSNKGNALIIDSYQDDPDTPPHDGKVYNILGVRKFETQSQVFNFSRKESKCSIENKPMLRKQSINCQSVNSHNISDKLKYMQIKDILDDEMVNEILSPIPKEGCRIFSEEQTLQKSKRIDYIDQSSNGMLDELNSPELPDLEDFKFLKNLDDND